MMNKNRFPKALSAQFLALLVFATALLLAGCGGAPEQGGEQAEAIPVEVVHPTRGDLERSLSFAGTIEPWREASLGAQISGRIEKIFAEVGEEVSAGQLLVQMSGEQLTQAEAQFRSAEKDWRRMKSLLDKGTITQQTFDKVDAGYEAAKASYELVLESTRLKAPFSGTITAKYLEEGEVFTLMPGTAGSPAILEIMQLDPVKVSLQASERDLPGLRRGMTVRLTTDPFPGREFVGKVNRIDPTVDPRSRMGSVELRIDNPRRLLKPGMFARVTVVLAEHRNTLTLPAECVLSENQETFVYLVNEGVARKRLVQTGLGTSELVEILSGVTSEDSVIRVGQRIVIPGQEVKIVNPAESEPEERS
jgi:membrane fusion protein (multidrug efflux system)